jgi:hypothetical protein
MKLYASIHGVCGIAEGYSDTTAQFFKTLEQAKEHKAKLLALLMKETHVDVTSTTDGLQDIVTYSHDEAEEEILKIVEVNPLWDTDNGESEVANNSFRSYTREWLMWNQLDCEAMYDGEYLPTDMGCIKEATDALHGTVESMPMDEWAEFVGDIYYRGEAMLDADDTIIHFFRVPKSDTL